MLIFERLQVLQQSTTQRQIKSTISNTNDRNSLFHPTGSIPGTENQNYQTHKVLLETNYS